MEIPANIAADRALTQQAVALSVIKQSAERDRALAGILEQAVDNVPTSPLRGSRVNISA